MRQTHTRTAGATALVILATLFLLASPAHAGLLEDAAAAAKTGDWEAAAEKYQAAMKQASTRRQAAIGLAGVITKGELGDLWHVAEDALHGLLEAKASDREARLALADLFLAKAATREDPTTQKFTYDDAKSQYAILLKANPADEPAAVGMARALYQMADFEAATQALDAFLTAGKSKGPALFWKGEVLYFQALDAYRTQGGEAELTKSLFGQALDAYAASAVANPRSYKTWMQTGYSAQYAGKIEQAREAYEKAMDLDPQKSAPLKGISAIYTYEPEKYGKVLQELPAVHPENVAVHYFLGFWLFGQGRHDEAVTSLMTFLEQADDPLNAWFYLGRTHEEADNWELAELAFKKALGINPEDLNAAGALDKRLFERFAPTGSDPITSPAASRAAIKAYEEIFALAPTNPLPRNNIAFLLRESVGLHAGEAAWGSVLRECVRIYEEATALAEAKIPARPELLPYATRHAYAGIINDTGLMYQYYPALLDLEKAEDYYVRALEITEDGYNDAYGNLIKIYVGAGRLEDAYDLAADCALGLKNADGTPFEGARAAAQSHADDLEKKLE